MSIFPRLNFLRKLFNRDVELAALDKDIAAVTDIADPGERLLRYDELAQRAAKLAARIRDAVGIPSIFSAFAGFVLLCGGASTSQPWIMAAGITLIGASTYASDQVGADSIDALTRRNESCKTAAKEILGNTPPLALARSPQFEKIVHSYLYPELREKFLLALVRENASPSAPATLTPAVKQPALKL